MALALTNVGATLASCGGSSDAERARQACAAYDRVRFTVERTPPEGIASRAHDASTIVRARRELIGVIKTLKADSERSTGQARSRFVTQADQATTELEEGIERERSGDPLMALGRFGAAYVELAAEPERARAAGLGRCGGYEPGG